jgi:hypothetical protein
MVQRTDGPLLAGSNDMELQLMDGPIEQQDRVELRAVRLSALEERLQTHSELDVLNTLASSDELLETVDATQVRVALISYRQERGGCGDAYGHLTLDDRALRGIISAAHELGAEGLWIDVWCYRVSGERYDHQDFCRTLHSVIGAVCAVCWLPRTKRGSTGEYPYRLWCTFEAACVQQRGLRVAVGGAGMTAFQHHVRRFGSFAPALYGDGIVDDLVRLNFFAYFTMASIVFNSIAHYIYPGDSANHEDQSFEWVAIANLAGLSIIIVAWFAGRTALSPEIHLAKNARVVLRIMEAASSEGNNGARGGGGAGDEPAPHATLLRELPWLSAYDRRDGLVVQELLALSRPDLRPSAREVAAQAISSHAAARLKVSAGDETATTLPLRAWLRERSIELDDILQQSEHACSRLSGSSASASASARRPSARLVALDSHTSAGTSRHPRNADAARSPLESLPLSELVRFGWTVASGSVCALLTPLGALAVASPLDGRWTTQASTPLRRAAYGKAIGWLLLVLLVQNVVDGTLQLLFGTHNEFSPDNEESDRWPNAINAAISAAIAAFIFAICLIILRADLPSICAGRVPLPIVVFNGVGASLTFGIACIVGCTLMLMVALKAFLPRMKLEAAHGNRWAVAHRISELASHFFMVLTLAYQLLLVVVLRYKRIVRYSRRRRAEEILDVSSM